MGISYLALFMHIFATSETAFEDLVCIMFIEKPSTLIELMARGRYLFLHHTQPAKSGSVEYHHHRWYKRDPQGRVVKIAKTYFEVMQPY